jgi:hypothetical protein
VAFRMVLRSLEWLKSRNFILEMDINDELSDKRNVDIMVCNEILI